MADLPVVAVIADAHLHDIHGNYDGAHTIIDDQQLTLRSWKDTRRSSRVFNESGDALNAALTDIHQRGVKHVVLLGDYTDDGQIESTERIAQCLHQFSKQYAMAFYAIPGNHDFFGPRGKHQSTRFVTTPGRSVLVTSDPEVSKTESDTSILTQSMFCNGSPECLLPMSEFGLFNQPAYLHWETPFGLSDTLADRTYDARSADGSVEHRLMDCSYLVEPIAGLWLLMIDANVFEPRNGQTDPTRKKTFLNSSDAGWNAVLHNKSFLIDWIGDVTARADRSGKHLLTFSHYPILDHFNEEPMSEFRLFGNNPVVRRTPHQSVADTLLKTGLKLHFSGHMHANSEERFHRGSQSITDIAVPSLVSFPAAYKLIQPTAKHCRADTISINTMSLNSALIKSYRAENKANGDADESALRANTYGDFLYRRMRCRVKHRSLETEWPASLRGEIENTTTADLAYFLLAQIATPEEALVFCPMQHVAMSELNLEYEAVLAQYDLEHDDLVACSMITLIADWYCLRQAGTLSRPYISVRNLKIYRCLAGVAVMPELQANESHALFFNTFLIGLKRSLLRAFSDGSQ